MTLGLDSGMKFQLKVDKKWSAVNAKAADVTSGDDEWICQRTQASLRHRMLAGAVDAFVS